MGIPHGVQNGGTRGLSGWDSGCDNNLSRDTKYIYIAVSSVNSPIGNSVTGFDTKPTCNSRKSPPKCHFQMFGSHNPSRECNEQPQLPAFLARNTNWLLLRIETSKAPPLAA